MGILDAPALSPAAADARYAKLVGTSTLSQGRANAFSPRTSAYNVTPSSFRRWNRALADQSIGIAAARVNCYGDSITFGATDRPTYQYRDTPAQLRKMFASRYGNSGTGVVYFIDHNGQSKPDPRITETGNWVRAATMGPYTYGTMRSPSGGTAEVSFTPEVAVDSFNLHLIKLTAGGDFTYKINDGVAVTVSSYNATNISTVMNIPVPAGLGMHKLTLIIPSTIDYYHYGVEGVAGTTTGVRVTNCSKGGAEASLLAGTSTAYNASRTVSFEMAVPQLSVFEFGMNEYLQQRDPLTVYKPNMQILIDKARALGSDILLVVTTPDGGTAKTIPQSEYAKIMYDLADENNLPLIDFQHRWASYAVSQPLGYYADPTHPGGAGYYDRARALFDVIAASA